MASNDGPPRNTDPRELIRRAGELADAEKVSEVLAKMDEDDANDDSADIVVLESDVASHSDGASGIDSSLIDSSTNAEGTVQEQDLSTDTTVGLPEDQLAAAVEGVESSGAPAPSLSDPSPSQHATSSSRSTLIVTPLYRPTRRPPMALLRVYDDNQTGAEEFRIRQSPFIIGRQDGDLVIGHERQMSRRHARIDRVEEGEAWRWYLGDLRSTNGTFLRVAESWLEDGVEVLLAGELVRFNQPLGSRDASLTKVGPTSEEERVRLPEGTHLVGSDPSACLAFLRSSPYLDPSNIRLECRKGRWRMVDLQSTNHIWISVSKRAELSEGSMFQIGEQRFSFHLP